MNERQKRFADEYLVDLNAEQAAIRAGYSERYARGNAHKLVANSCIAKYIAERKQDRVERTEITQDMVLKELAIIAFAKVTDYARVIEKDATVEVDGILVPLLDEEGKPVKFRTVEPVLTEELTEEQKKALAVVKKGRDGFELKPYDKMRALELLGKHIGMFTDKVEVTNTGTDPFDELSVEELKKLIEDD